MALLIASVPNPLYGDHWSPARSDQIRLSENQARQLQTERCERRRCESTDQTVRSELAAQERRLRERRKQIGELAEWDDTRRR